MKYTCINIQGNLVSEEILQKVEAGTAEGQTAEKFGLEKNANLKSEIEYAWSRIKLDWKHFSDRNENLPATDPYGTSIARRWMKNFFGSLGFELKDEKAALTGDNNKTYFISNTADNLDDLPVHIVGFYDPGHPERNTLDTKSSGGTSRMSPHATMQEYLNVTEHVYGMATNGLYLRLIRDSGRLVKLTYVEFDLKRMLEEDRYSEFTVLYRLLHSSRFPRSKQEVDQCLLEAYYKESIETGNRIRNGLSSAVKESLLALGKGFLQQEDNAMLREQLQSGKMTPKDFYRQLLRLIYRFLFLMVTEERDLVYDPENKNTDLLRKKRMYLQYYSIARLRRMSQQRYLYEARYNDLWQGLVQTFQLFDEMGSGKKMGIQPLAGDLFNSHALPALERSLISNALLLECVRNMNEFEDEKKNLVPINYRSLDVEELGSVYEGLLELHPVIENLEATNPAHINFTFHEGTDRKTTGSYYTRPDLVNELIKSALIPVIEARLNEHTGNKEAQAKALLKLKVCDAAAGSGHMLLAAARTIAWYLARVQTGEDNPAPSVYRTCLREAIQHCVYAVDMNPDAVELCKLALWLEGHNSGKPLSFLDHKIRNGNSLVGVTDLSVLTKGIPDEAFNPVTGDDKEVCKKLKKDNAAFNKTKQSSLFDQADSSPDAHAFSDEYHELDDIKQDDVAAVQMAQQKFNRIRSGNEWFKDWRACNLWTAAFFYTYTEGSEKTAPTSQFLKNYLQSPGAALGTVIGKADALQAEHKFFHWPLEFPDVWEQGGFDVMLGNPPWERIKLQQEEYFATRDIRIKNAANSAARNKLIKELPLLNPQLFHEYQNAMHNADALGKFLRESGRCNLTAVGDINTYSIFSELTSSLVNKDGATGIIVPTGIATDDGNKAFFGAMVENNRLITLFDFENKEAIFQEVHRSYKFCLLTLSGSDVGNKKARFGFFLSRVEHLLDKLRIFSLSKEDFLRLNPNTKTCPIFRTSVDAELTVKLYRRYPIFINELKQSNFWGASIRRLFDMGNPKVSVNIGREATQDRFSPIFESKMMWQYDHRFATYKASSEQEKTKGSPLELSVFEKRDANQISISRNFISKYEVPDIISNWLKNRAWLLGYRDVTNATNERTIVASIYPATSSDFTLRVQVFSKANAQEAALLLANYNSLCLDFICRQKIGGMHISDYIFIQLPILIQGDYDDKPFTIIARVLELIYTSWDIKSFADDIWKEADEDLKAAIQKQWNANKEATGGHEWAPPECCEINETGCPLPPFKWDEDRRAVLKAELDAIYAHLYGLTTEELRYILDPQDVYGPDFPGETFRVLKEKEIRNYGEYRTRRLVLEAWERLHNKSIKSINSLDLPRISEPMKEFTVHEGIYSIQDAAHITKIPAARIRRWFRDLRAEQYEGLSEDRPNDVESMRISFHGLIEIVVIDTLRENKFSLKAILVARNDLQQKSGKIYPFATNNVRDNLKIAGKSLVFRFESGDVTLNGSGQYNLAFIQEFFKHIEFDTNGVAQRMFGPASNLIVIDPKQAGGKAAIDKKGVWAETISMAYDGPESIPMLTEQYEITQEEVLAAIEYYN